MLGNPDDVTCGATFLNPMVRSGDPVRVSLADLKLRPMDVLALARAALQPNQGSLLDSRILDKAFGADDEPGLRVDYAPFETGDRTFPQVLEVESALGTVLAGARPLRTADLLSSAESARSVDAAIVRAIADEIEERAEDGKGYLHDEQHGPPYGGGRGQRQPVARGASRGRAFGARAWVRADRSIRGRAGELAEAVASEFDRRLAAAPAIAEPPAPTPSDAERIEVAIEVLKALSGADFFAMPQVAIANPTRSPRPSARARNLSLHNDAPPDPNNPPPPPVDELAPLRFLQQASYAREPLRRFRKFNLYARAFGRPAPRIDVVQLPFVPGERWLGMPFGERPSEGRTALLLLSNVDELEPTDVWTGILLESWTEIVPSTIQRTQSDFRLRQPRRRRTPGPSSSPRVRGSTRTGPSKTSSPR